MNTSVKLFRKWVHVGTPVRQPVCANAFRHEEWLVDHIERRPCRNMAAWWKACGRGCEPACVRWPLWLLVLRVSTSSCGRNLPGSSERDRGSVPRVAVRWLLCSCPCEGGC